MGKTRRGRQTVIFENPPSVLSWASVVGKKEGLGPLAEGFDIISQDGRFGRKTWEQGEQEMQRQAIVKAMEKGRVKNTNIDYVFSGDLLNQCISSSFALRGLELPSYGLYGACSTMAEALSLAAMTVAGGFASVSAAMASSHFATAERQYRYPMEYGGQRTPTAQWTATAAGAVLLGDKGSGPYITSATCGIIRDMGIKDVNNMGAAMAPAAYDTIKAHLTDMGIEPSYYDLIVTGDLGRIGKSIVTELFTREGADISGVYEDCGVLLFDMENQDVHGGASGCGCSAAVLTGRLLEDLKQGRIKRLLFAGTGALQSPTSFQQGETIPGICHAVSIEAGRK